MAKIDAIKELKNPNFIKPIEIHYTLKSVKRVWEAVISYDSVSILLWHRDKDAFVLVKQLRPAVLHATQKDGYTYELCAGIIDKDASDVQIAKEEVFEECGYDVPLENLQKVTTFYPSVGVTGAYQTLYYAEINASMKVSEGGGLADENIEVIYLPTQEAKKFIFDESYQKTPGMMMAFYWFFDNKI